MKNIILISIFFLGTISLHSETFDIGGKEINIPAPEGFSIVTSEMKSVEWLISKMSNPENELVSFYIQSSIIKDLLKGEMPVMERTFNVQVAKKLKNSITGKDFLAEVKNVIISQNKNFIQQIENKSKDLLSKSSQEISQDLDVDYEMKLTEMKPLTPHYDSENSFSYSIYMTYEGSVEINKKRVYEKNVTVMTNTLLSIGGKILFLYCYGSENDLEWTRSASKEWADDIISRNDASPENSATSTSSQNNNYKWISRIAAFIIFSLISGFLYKRGRPNKSIEKNQGSGIIKK